MAEWGIGDQADSDTAGRYYQTACGQVLHSAAAAVLTTDRSTCPECTPGGGGR